MVDSNENPEPIAPSANELDSSLSVCGTDVYATVSVNGSEDYPGPGTLSILSLRSFHRCVCGDGFIWSSF